MRFRGLVCDGHHIQTFIKVLQSFAKFSETFLIRLSENELQLLNDSPQTLSPFVVKCSLNREEYFEEYSFRGVTSDDNVICLRLRSEGISQVLASFLSHIKCLKLRLSKGSMGLANDCLLCIAVNYPTHSDSDRQVCHQIKIDVIRSEEWNDICGQDLHSFDLSLYLPDYRVISTTTERLNDLCHYINVRAKRVDTKALLVLSVENDSIVVKSKFNGLDLNTDEDIDINPEINDNLVSVRVNARKMSLLFSTLKHLKPTAIISNIIDKNRIYFQFFHNSVKFGAFLPNIDI